jgi:myo-inositol catabolism protein IolC
VVAQARSGGRQGVVCIILGRGVDEPKVVEWLRVASSVEGFDGFAVGRTIWNDPLRRFLAGDAPRERRSPRDRDALQRDVRRVRRSHVMSRARRRVQSRLLGTCDEKEKHES